MIRLEQEQGEQRNPNERDQSARPDGPRSGFVLEEEDDRFG